MPIAEFAYNNAKNISTSYTPSKLNCGYHFCLSFKEDIDLGSQSKIAEDFTNGLKDLLIIYLKNLIYIQKLQKQAQNKGVKPGSYVLVKRLS